MRICFVLCCGMVLYIECLACDTEAWVLWTVVALVNSSVTFTELSFDLCTALHCIALRSKNIRFAFTAFTAEVLEEAFQAASFLLGAYLVASLLVAFPFLAAFPFLVAFLAASLLAAFPFLAAFPSQAAFLASLWAASLAACLAYLRIERLYQKPLPKDYIHEPGGIPLGGPRAYISGPADATPRNMKVTRKYIIRIRIISWHLEVASTMRMALRLLELGPLTLAALDP